MNRVQSDLALSLPLHGVHLIEASAGTGKTFTLTAWMLRLLLEAGAPLPNLLAVTFTRAATAELRERIRERLRIAEAELAGRAYAGDEAVQTAAIIGQARARGIPDETLRTRLQTALLQIDQASVFTIHGFCQRALSEYGFLAGGLNSDPLFDHADDLQQQVASDLWRSASHGEAGDFESMYALWETPQKLAQDLPRLCDPSRRLLPEAGGSELAGWLHRLREKAASAFGEKLRENRRRTPDQLIEQTWRASAQPRFAAALQRHWPWLLIDEFQDTDPHQWDIFRRIHQAKPDENTGLFLIGDPKQAIYRFRGGDLPTYLRARDYARQQGGEDSLAINYRSRPSVLAAIETLFTGSPAPFGDPAIDFVPVQPAPSATDDALKVEGRAPPGLTIHYLPAHRDGKARRAKSDDEATAVAITVAEIRRLLEHGTLHEGGAQRRVGPQDITVLVRKNAQVAMIREALTRAGIPAAGPGSDSVFASDAASDLRRLLRAIAMPADPQRQRAALATRLLGLDAEQIAATNQYPVRQRQWQVRFETAASQWQRRGPLPALMPFLTGVSRQRLAEQGGARLLTDALHLIELLQAEAPMQHGLHGLLQWFEQHCETPSPRDEHHLRLDADARAVQVLTVHKSKGLEYPIVLLPFTAFGSHAAPRGGLQLVQVRDAADRPAYYAYRSNGSGKQREWILCDPAHEDWLAQQRNDERNEELRLLYVGLTRARHALHLVWGRTSDSNDTALQWLLHGEQCAGSKKNELKPEDLRMRAQQLADASAGTIALRDIPEPLPPQTPWVMPAADAPVPAPRQAERWLRNRSGQYSFSGLRTRHIETLPVRGADDEPAASPLDADTVDEPDRAPVTLLAGPDFGNAVHDALEAADFAAWDGVVGIPPRERPGLRQALQRRGLPQGERAQQQIGDLVVRALNAPLPGIGTLARLPSMQRVSEMEFHFRLGDVPLPALFDLLAAHGHPRQHGEPREGVIEGYMHGYVDLLYRDGDGRHHVVDYKTNRLPGYGSEELAQAVRGNDYDLQYLIYLVAVQRWLRQRFGDAYDAEKHLGGAVYLFLRGLPVAGVADTPVPGIFFDRPAQGLIDALDRLFDGGDE
ncbi:MAG: UvrD-helicase domain-containing protein [Xanthomonadaceae bacterium]|jgi:exodeoxyribonuclease V beta subunit|nr:UvrD-helicase domain-containing protein [Xanthomonadaceae bacterium]